MNLHCIGTPLADEELAATLDDPPPAAVLVHLAQCAFCRAELAAITAIDNRLTTTFNRVACPAPLRLVEYSMQSISAEERAQIAAHAKECQQCIEELASYAEIDSSPAQASQPGSPRVPAGIGSRFVTGVRDRIAQLVPLQLQPATRLRGPQPAVYEATGFDIQLSHSMQAPGTLRGKIRRKQSSGLDLHLEEAFAQLFTPQSDIPLATAFIRETGVFVFEIEPPADYIIRLTLADDTIGGDNIFLPISPAKNLLGF